MRFHRYCLASIVLCSLGLPRDAGAESVTYNFSGTIDQAFVLGSGTVPSGVSQGMAFTGSATFQMTAPSSSTATSATYDGALLDLKFIIGSTSYTKALIESYPRTELYNTTIVDNDVFESPGLSRDRLYSSVQSGNRTDPNHELTRVLNLVLQDEEASPAALSSTAIPTGPLDLSKFITLHYIQFSDSDYNDSTSSLNKLLIIRGNITSIQFVPSSVPAPPAIAMLGLGLSSAAAWRRARRQSA